MDSKDGGLGGRTRLFCEAEPDRELLTVNLERHPHLAEAFAGNDPATVLHVIEAASDRSVSERTVLFLDEIQAAPSAFVALRYFLEEMPDLPIVSAGSLMEFMLSDHKFPRGAAHGTQGQVQQPISDWLERQDTGPATRRQVDSGWQPIA